MFRKMRGPLLAVIVGLATGVQSQFSPCGETCIYSLFSQAASLGCSPNDAACLCGNVNFGNGIRDCAYQACGTSGASAFLSYASSFCGSALYIPSSTQSDASSHTTTIPPISTTTTSDVEPSSISSTVLTEADSSTTSGPSSSAGSSQSVTSSLSITSGQRSTSGPSITSSPSITSLPSIATSSSVTSSTQSPISSETQGAANGGLTTGTKAGIGIGVSLAVIIVLLLAIFLFMRRKRKPEQSTTQDMETAESLAVPRSHEMITSANTHELAAKEPDAYVEMDGGPHGGGDLHGIKEQSDWPVHSISPATTEGVAEMDGQIITNINSGSNPESGRVSELDATTHIPRQADTHSPLTDPAPPTVQHSSAFSPISKASPDIESEPKPLPKNAYSPPTEPSSSTDDPDDKVEVLKKRMQKVREDKERLQKIQALKELEEELQAELLMEQKKTAGI